uniref:Uncharacterized protein n=1 Tax=Glossina pallidipes TaxID=7398 RepID=A0A1A9ZNF9_GLOPL
MAECVKCSKCIRAIRGGTGVQCQGVCGRVCHTTRHCCGLVSYSLQVLQKNGLLWLMCHDCTTYIRNVDLALKEILGKVGKSRRILKEFYEAYPKSQKKNEIKISNMLEEVEDRVDPKLKAIRMAMEKNEKFGSKPHEMAKRNHKEMLQLAEIAGRIDGSAKAKQLSCTGVVKAKVLITTTYSKKRESRAKESIEKSMPKECRTLAAGTRLMSLQDPEQKSHFKGKRSKDWDLIPRVARALLMRAASIS